MGYPWHKGTRERRCSWHSLFPKPGMLVCGWTQPAGYAPLSSSRKPAPAQVGGRPLSDALLTQSLLSCLDYFLGSFPDSGVGNQAMEKITNRGTGGSAHEEQHETDHRGGREKWKLLLISGAGEECRVCCFCRGTRSWFPAATAGGSQSPATPAAGYLMLS